MDGNEAAAFERSNDMKTLHSWAGPIELTPSSPSA